MRKTFRKNSSKKRRRTQKGGFLGRIYNGVAGAVKGAAEGFMGGKLILKRNDMDGGTVPSSIRKSNCSCKNNGQTGGRKRKTNRRRRR